MASAAAAALPGGFFSLLLLSFLLIAFSIGYCFRSGTISVALLYTDQVIRCKCEARERKRERGIKENEHPRRMKK